MIFEKSFLSSLMCIVISILVSIIISVQSTSKLPLKYKRSKLLLKFTTLNAMYSRKPSCHTIFNLHINNNFYSNIKLLQPIY